MKTNKPTFDDVLLIVDENGIFWKIGRCEIYKINRSYELFSEKISIKRINTIDKAFRAAYMLRSL